MSDIIVDMSKDADTRSIRELEHEVKLLRSFAIGHLGKDPEGEYRPEFVERALAAAQEEAVDEFSDTESFLREMREQ
jgi:hypothetical protein